MNHYDLKDSLLRKKLRKNARITALKELWLVDLMNRLPVEPAAFPLSLKRSSRSTEIPARTGAKTAAGCGTEKCQCCE
jgi:hypothetical protein